MIVADLVIISPRILVDRTATQGSSLAGTLPGPLRELRRRAVNREEAFLAGHRSASGSAGQVRAAWKVYCGRPLCVAVKRSGGRQHGAPAIPWRESVRHADRICASTPARVGGAHRTHFLPGPCARRSTHGAGTDAPKQDPVRCTGGGDRTHEASAAWMRRSRSPTQFRQMVAAIIWTARFAHSSRPQQISLSGASEKAYMRPRSGAGPGSA